MTKRFLMAGCFAALLWAGTSCDKTTSTANCATVAQEDPTLQSWVAGRPGVWTKHPSGIYYQIENPGAGQAPFSNSSIRVSYVGTLMNGTQFDASPPAGLRFQLNGVISSWQIVLPLIRPGGRIKFLSPSPLAYGCTGSGTSIPPNTPLYFEVNLIEVN